MTNTLKWRISVFFLLCLFSPPVHAETGPLRPDVIAGFGSSVCNGSGDEFQKEGYIGRLRDAIAERGWTVLNVSRGGDNTRTIQDRWEKTEKPPVRSVREDRYLLPHAPQYVIIGLSLANEGIRNGGIENRERVFEQFRTGMLGIIQRLRKEGMVPIVANCYPHGDYEPEHYEAVKRMNLLINNWDVPSVNLLGSVDDGRGRWAKGFEHDPGHPSAGGHQEMFHAFVPTQFDALQQGKALPVWAREPGYATVENAPEPVLLYQPDDPIHSFTVSCGIRATSDGRLITISGQTGIVEKTQAVSAGDSFSGSMIHADRKPFTASLSIQDKKLVYTSSAGAVLTSQNPLKLSGWSRITLSHCCASGKTHIYLDEVLAGTVEERIIPAKIGLGGPGTIAYRDWMIHRSALNRDEIHALCKRQMIQSSLELYAPLQDAAFTLNEPVENRAQSLSKAFVRGDSIRTGR